MSHFAVLIIGPNALEQLASYQENNMGNCPKELLTFESVNEEYKRYFAKENKGAKYESTEAYEAAFDKYMEEGGDYTKDRTTGEYGYWENTNAKWDWYSLGGRYTGMLKLKADVNKDNTTIGRPGVFGRGADDGCVDVALKRDIDFAGMIADAELKAKDEYEKIEAIFPDGIPKIEISWESIIDSNGIHKNLSNNDKQYLYNRQYGVSVWKDATRTKANEFEATDNELYRFYLWAEQQEFQCSKEEYIKIAGQSAFSTYAVVKDGKWYERGHMGWWGVSFNEKDETEWDVEFSNLVNNLPDDTLLSIYDCHI